MIFANGAKQFVVQDAFETMVSSALTSLWLTPITNIGAVLEGAEITTFFAPAFKCAEALSFSVKIPVQSIIISAPTASHLRFSGFFSAVTLIIFHLHISGRPLLQPFRRIFHGRNRISKGKLDDLHLTNRL
jgi:hypothetical protein